MMVNYYYKYVKYKSKYLQFKKNMIGGKKEIIIHVSGPSGAGKTTLGKKLSDIFGDEIVVMDIDDLRHKFVEYKYGDYKNVWGKKNFKWDADGYQKYIDKYIAKQNKPIVFVGLNHLPWWHKKLYYNMHSDYNYYIKLDSDIIFKQKCSRFMNGFFVEKRDKVIKDIIKNEKNTIDNINNNFKYECGYKETSKMNKIWNRDYKKQGYKFMTREKILEEVTDILNRYIS